MNMKKIEMFLKLLDLNMDIAMVYGYEVLGMLIEPNGISFNIQEICPNGEKNKPYILTFSIELGKLFIYNALGTNCITFPFENDMITKEELNQNIEKYQEIIKEYEWFL